jgi:hypothetical protein
MLGISNEEAWLSLGGEMKEQPQHVGANHHIKTLCKPLDSSVSFDFDLPEELKEYEQFMLEKERTMLEERDQKLMELEEKGNHHACYFLVKN